jgi:hypothetical protein
VEEVVEEGVVEVRQAVVEVVMVVVVVNFSQQLSCLQPEQPHLQPLHHHHLGSLSLYLPATTHHHQQQQLQH